MEPKFYTAKTYENAARVGKPFTMNNKLYTRIKFPCARCNGSGIFPSPVDSGVCYDCGGQGYSLKNVRLYTESEYAAMERAKAQKEEKAAATAQEKAYAAKGFNEDGLTYIICGGNTYNIKDMLKEQGCRFDPYLKWHSPTKIEVPAPFKVVPVNFSDVYQIYNGWASQKEGGDDFIKELFAEAAPAEELEGEYCGEVGQRLRNISVTLEKCTSFDSAYGLKFCYCFKDAENHFFTWFTTSVQMINEGDALILAGTVKEHKDYRGKRVTYLSRCKIEAAE